MKTQDELVELSRIKFPIGNGKLSEARMGFREGYKQCEQEQLNLHIVSECCGNPDIIQTTVTYQYDFMGFKKSREPIRKFLETVFDRYGLLH